MRVRIVHVSKTFVEGCSNARRNARTKPEAIKIADCSEKSTFFSHSPLQSSYSLVHLTIDLGFKVVEGLNELVEEKKNWRIINSELQWIDGGCPDSDKGHQIIFNTFFIKLFPAH